MSGIRLRCCEKKQSFQIEYEIGTTYLVCNFCLTKPHFMRGIKAKKSIKNNSNQSQFSFIENQPLGSVLKK